VSRIDRALIVGIVIGAILGAFVGPCIGCASEAIEGSE
jgi:hypothetical protein